MTFKDTLALSYKNILSNRLRTVITVIIIAMGIFALIFIITLIQAASNSLTTSFSTMGANAFSLRFKERNMHFGGGGGKRNTSRVSKSSLKVKNSNTGLPITYDEAREFKQRYSFPAIVGIAIRGPQGVVVNNDKKKTNPDVNLYGGDENYLKLNGYTIAYGRDFTTTEVEAGANVCMLGSGVAQKLYPNRNKMAIDQVVRVDHIPYRVIAVLEDKNSSAFFNTSKIVITPYNNVRRLYATANSSFNIGVMVNDIKQLEPAIAEAKGTFRPVRKLDVKEEDNFYVDKSDSIAATLIKNLGFISIGTVVIAFITLIGAAVCLMNIMLVAVNERTREIGLAKALGGTKKDIRSQFLWESILISLIGAASGILAGILFGNLVGAAMKSGFVFPFGWVVSGIFVCFFVGLAAGLYPAHKASKLDPIVALRYE